MPFARARSNGGSVWVLHPRDRSAILDFDPNRKIVPVDVKRDLDILGV
jgi:hypothetical protein